MVVTDPVAEIVGVLVLAEALASGADRFVTGVKDGVNSVALPLTSVVVIEPDAESAARN